MTTAMACELANAHAPYMQVHERTCLHGWLRAPTWLARTCIKCCKLCMASPVMFCMNRSTTTALNHVVADNQDGQQSAPQWL